LSISDFLPEPLASPTPFPEIKKERKEKKWEREREIATSLFE